MQESARKNRFRNSLRGKVRVVADGGYEIDPYNRISQRCFKTFDSELTGTPTSRGTYKKNLTHTVFRTLVIGDQMRKISEREMRLTIGMMRSMASCKPISPFHLQASKDMERMLEELLELRKQTKEKKSADHR